jgi:hypothetical protein
MADISITAANVVAGSGASTTQGTAGETIAAGKTVVFDEAAKKWKLADSNGVAAIRVPQGIALNGASLNQPLNVVKSGPVTIGATLTPGVAYYQSDTPGGICPVADVGSGEYATIVGMATSATVLDVDIQASGVAL